MSVLLAAVLLAAPPSAWRPAEEVIGEVQVHRVAPGESLIELARDYDLGFNEIAAANPRLDPFVPKAGALVLLPTAWILPAAAAPSTLVVNLSEMRLYLFGRGEEAPLTFPVGTSLEPWVTPLGDHTIVEKLVEPTWYPPPALRAEDPELPLSVPPGEENPLGSHALRLSERHILIHGTNRPFGVGRKVSHGCIRLYPEDIPVLFGRVDVGGRVRIVREPVKVGVREGRVLVEIHADERVTESALDEALRLLRDRGVLDRVDARKLARAARAQSGVPVDVTDDAATPRG